jgi:uncharacterized membrane-anchored protein YitT (DUF2179 family)
MIMLGTILALFVLTIVCPWVFPNHKVSDSPFDAE